MFRGVQGWQEDGFMAAFSLCWISLLPFLISVLPYSAERVRESNRQGEFAVQDWKRANFFQFFFQAGILGALQTDVACHLLIVQGNQLVECRGFTDWKITSHLFVVITTSSARYTENIKTPKKLVYFICYLLLLFPPTSRPLPFVFFSFVSFFPILAAFWGDFCTVVACLSCIFWWATVDMTACTFCQATQALQNRGRIIWKLNMKANR